MPIRCGPRRLLSQMFPRHSEEEEEEEEEGKTPRLHTPRQFYLLNKQTNKQTNTWRGLLTVRLLVWKPPMVDGGAPLSDEERYLAVRSSALMGNTYLEMMDRWLRT